MEQNRSSSSSLSSNITADSIPEFNSIPAEKWMAVEAPIDVVLNRVRPTSDSDEKRNDVVEYMRLLIIEKVGGGVEVLQYGSVPLKMYLPEGDIDLTVVSVPGCGRNLPLEVHHALLAEEQNENDEYKLKDIRFIDAEVKLVKCAVNDITIDISFNQMSGICALCFLEQVDRLIGKNHLFKRSIILIKSWCYYESRILGSMYGLLSTYALEILVLYIFRMYNASLASPLMVLYRFLEYYGKFDWDKFGISIDGPVNLSLLPDIVVENPIYHALLGGEYLRSQINLCTVPCKAPMGYRSPFNQKVINIIDPLKTNNNLGRSIRLGNFLRIRLALRFGAHKLAETLKLPREKIEEGIKNFFDNTLTMNVSKCCVKLRLTFDDEEDIQSESLYADLESDNLRLADLSGDYYGNLRSLLTSQHISRLCYSSVPEHHLLAVRSYPNGSVMQLPAPNGSVMQFPAQNLPAHQTSIFIPSTGPSTRENGRGFVPPLPEPNWAHGITHEVASCSGANSDCLDQQGDGQSCAPSQVHTYERRLEFGSFGRGSMTIPEPEQTCNMLDRRLSERVLNMSLPLTDDNEFPPL